MIAVSKDRAKLSARQERFVEQYSLCGNAAEAARLAGYSSKTARVIGAQNLSKVSVRKALAARQSVFREELRVTKAEVISGLQEAIQTARDQQNPAAMISGLAQIAKLCGFYESETRRVELSSAACGNLKAKFVAMTDAELIGMISAN